MSDARRNAVADLSNVLPGRFELFEKNFVQAHNHFRRLHGINALALSRELCDRAELRAEEFANMEPEEIPELPGVNLYKTRNFYCDGGDAVEHWYKQGISELDFNELKLTKTTAPTMQLLWKSTTRVGYGFARRGDLLYVVGVYQPAGNIKDQLNQNVFKVVDPQEPVEYKPGLFFDVPESTAEPDDASDYRGDFDTDSIGLGHEVNVASSNSGAEDEPVVDIAGRPTIDLPSRCFVRTMSDVDSVEHAETVEVEVKSKDAAEDVEPKKDEDKPKEN